MSETLETMLEAMPDSYQKTVGFPTYDLLAAAAIPMEELEAQLQETAAKLDPANLTGEDLERYVKSRSGLVRNPPTCASGILQVTGNGTVNEGISLSPPGASSLPPRPPWTSPAAERLPSAAPRWGRLVICLPGASP